MVFSFQHRLIVARFSVGFSPKSTIQFQQHSGHPRTALNFMRIIPSKTLANFPSGREAKTRVKQPADTLPG
jgi:hypothetical protein